MADLKGENMTNVDGDGGASDFVHASKVGGRRRTFADVHEASAAAIADRILVARLPKGAVILPESVIVADALGTGVTLEVGDGTTSDKFVAATAMNTADKKLYLSKIAGIGEELAEETEIWVTVGGAEANGTIKSFLSYSYD